MTLAKDEWIGDDNPHDPLNHPDPDTSIDDMLPVSIPTAYTVTINVSANSAETVDVLLSITSHQPCTADWVPEAGDTVLPPIDLNGTHIGRLQYSVNFAGPGTIVTQRDYSIHCTAPGTWLNSDALQILANVSNGGPTPPLDPDQYNNQAQNHVNITATLDIDGDTFPNPSDNCPYDPNLDQIDSDGDGMGNICDPDDDNDTIPDLTDQCPLVQEDLDGVQDTDGCPDTDASVSVQKDHNVSVDVSTTTSFPVTVTATNGNYPANVEYQLLLVSNLDPDLNLVIDDRCEARWVQQAGDLYGEDQTDENGDTIIDTLYSQITRLNDDLVGPLAPFESRSMTRSYNLHCYQSSNHSVHLEAGVVPQPPVREENVANNVQKQDIQIESWDRADLKIVSQSVLSPPTNIDAGTDVPITLHKVLHNNGPYTGAVTSTLTSTATAPAGCTVSAPPAPQQVTLPYSVDVTVDEVYTIRCDQASTHSFGFDNEITVAPGQHVHDLNPSNNTKHTDLTVNAIGTADVKIVSQAVVNPPTDINVSENKLITLRKVLHNTGPYIKTVTATLTSAATAPQDCSVSPPPAPQQVSLPYSVDVTVDEQYTLHCTQPSRHTWTFDNTLSAAKEPHVVDPNLPNVHHTDLTLYAWATADVKIVSWTFPDDLPVPGNQVLVQPSVPEDIVSSETLHNNGPYGPVDATVAKTVADTADCDVTPNAPAASVVTLAVSTDGQDNETFSVHWTNVKKPPYSCDLVFNKTVTITTAHVSDPNGATEQRTVTLVRDTDNDGVPDNYAGMRDNCQDVPNPDQEDEDQDGLGDACDPIPAHDVQVISMVAYGPAPINLSDNVGRYMWVIGKIYNPITKSVSHDELVKIGLTLTIPTAMQGCSITSPTSSGLIIPGSEGPFILRDQEAKWVLYRIRFECHASVLPSVSDVGVELCITHLAQSSDDDGDTRYDEDPINGADDDGDSLIDEDPAEGNELPPYLANNCRSANRAVIVHQP